MRSKITVITSAAALLLAAGTVFAQPCIPLLHGPGRGIEMLLNQGHGDILEAILPILRHIDLTDYQRSEIREIAATAREQIEELHDLDEIRERHENFRELFSSSTLTAQEIKAFLDNRITRMETMNEIFAEAIADIHHLLTPEQLQLIAEFEPDQACRRMRERNSEQIRPAR